jgi:hypothetical protein
MSCRLRPWLTRHRKLALAVSAGWLCAGAALCALEWREWFAGPRHPVYLTKAYYTVDDGRTWFVDRAERIPPFDDDGRPAVRAQRFTCDHGKTTFVAFLQKIPDEVLQRYRDRGIDPATVDDDDLAEEGGWLAKRPGDDRWVSSKTDRDAYDAIVNVRCPDGTGTPEPVIPPE